MNFSKILKLIILAPIVALIIYIPLGFIVSKVPICGNDFTEICQGLVFTFLFIVTIIVITGFLGEKILGKKDNKYEESPSKIFFSKVLTYGVIAPLAILLTFFLLYIIQKILYKF